MTGRVEETRFKVIKRLDLADGRALEVGEILDIVEIKAGYRGGSHYILDNGSVVNAEDFNLCTEDVTMMVTPKKLGKWEI